MSALPPVRRPRPFQTRTFVHLQIQPERNEIPPQRRHHPLRLETGNPRWGKAQCGGVAWRNKRTRKLKSIDPLNLQSAGFATTLSERPEHAAAIPSPGDENEEREPLRRGRHRRAVPGRVTLNSVPVPGVLFTSMVPPWAVMMALQMARPRPVRPSMRERALSAR
jgi:hypothetical protein